MRLKSVVYTWRVFLWINWWNNFANRSTFAKVINKHQVAYFFETQCILSYCRPTKRHEASVRQICKQISLKFPPLAKMCATVVFYYRRNFHLQKKPFFTGCKLRRAGLGLYYIETAWWDMLRVVLHAVVTVAITISVASARSKLYRRSRIMTRGLSAVRLHTRRCTALPACEKFFVIRYDRMISYATITQNSWYRRSKPRPAPHCRVLPPGEFNSIIPVQLPI